MSPPEEAFALRDQHFRATDTTDGAFTVRDHHFLAAGTTDTPLSDTGGFAGITHHGPDLPW